MTNTRPLPDEPEGIVTKFRRVEDLAEQGVPGLDAIRQIGVTQQTFWRWKKTQGGMGTDQQKELKQRRGTISDLTLDKLIQAGAATGNV